MVEVGEGGKKVREARWDGWREGRRKVGREGGRRDGDVKVRKAEGKRKIYMDAKFEKEFSLKN